MFGLDLHETQFIILWFMVAFILFVAIQWGINSSKAGKLDRIHTINNAERKAESATAESKRYTDAAALRLSSELVDLRKNMTIVQERLAKVENFPAELLDSIARMDGELAREHQAFRADQI